MVKKRSFSTLLELFAVFFKIGLVTFGGGLAMIPLISRITCEKKKWIKEEELFDMIAISESTPGPVAVNTATYVGYKVHGFLGALFSTLGLIIPSFVIIIFISLFYKAFMSIAIIQAAFKGIEIGVILLLFMALFKLYRILDKTAFNIVLLIGSLIISLISQILFISISIGNFNLSLNLLLIFFGLILGLIKILKERRKQS